MLGSEREPSRANPRERFQNPLFSSDGRGNIPLAFIFSKNIALISSKNIKEHEKHLREVLKGFRKSQLFANLKKCAIYQKKAGHFLRPRYLS